MSHPKAKSDLSKTDVPKLQEDEAWSLMLKPGYLIGSDKTVRIRKLYRGPDHDRNKGGKIDQTHYVNTNAEGNITEFIFKFDDDLTH